MRETIYNFWSQYDPARPFHLIMTGISYCDHTYMIERRPSPSYSFEYIIQGRGTLEIDGRTVHPAENDVYLFWKGSRHRYYADPDDPWVKIWAVFDGPLAQTLFDSYLPKGTCLVKDCNILPFMEELLAVAARGATNPSGREGEREPAVLSPPAAGEYDTVHDAASILALRVMLRLREHLARPAGLPEQIKNWLDLRAEDKVALDHMAADFHYSKNRLIQVFKEAYGLTPYAYLKAQKLRLARQYLTDTGLSIAEIAARLSFADPQYFADCFKAETGLTPTAYRAAGNTWAREGLWEHEG